LIRFKRIFLIILIISHYLSGQVLDPPYPRLGIFTFSNGRSRNMEASVDILKDFDVLAFPPTTSALEAYRADNPDRPLLGTSGCLIAYGMTGIPEAWYYHDIHGDRFLLFGSSYLMNLTINCPLKDMGNGPERFIDYAARHLTVEMDFSLYDGVFYDWWWGGMGSDAKTRGDLDSSGVADINEWGIDSLRYVWQQGLREFHDMQNSLPGNPYGVVQVGADWNIWSFINGVCFEDWPVYNGPWERWRGIYNDQATQGLRDPRLMLLDAAHRHFAIALPAVIPYKNNYTSVRFAFSSCLLTSAYFFVDEGNMSYPETDGRNGHHGNIHFYDEMSGKGQLGYPLTDMIKLPGKAVALKSSTGTPEPNADGVYVRFFDNGVSVVNATGIGQSINASELAAYDPAAGSGYFRFRGGQDPQFNNGEPVTDSDPLFLWGIMAQANWFDLEVFGDGAMLFREPDTLITPIIVDNHVNNQTSPGSDPIQHIGSWTLTSQGHQFYAYYYDRNYGPFQPDGFAWSPAGDGENVALYVPTIGLNGYYEVYEWHGQHDTQSPQATDVPIRIQYAGDGDSTLTVNQSIQRGQWNSLGIYPFISGTTGRAELSNAANGYVIADAIRWVFVRGFTAAEEDSLGSGGSTAVFSDVTSAAQINTLTGSSGCCWADINEDGRPDLYITRSRGENSTDQCYINMGNLVFSEESATMGIEDQDDGSRSACWGDLDNDGDFDLVNGTILRLPEDEGEHNDVYRNNGDGSFSDVTDDPILGTRMKTRSVVLFDMDNDFYLDIFSVPGYLGTNDTPPWSHPNEVYHNAMAFAFEAWDASDCGALLTAPAGHGATATDFDNDGDLDIFAANQTGPLNILINNGQGLFALVSDPASLGITHGAGSGITMGDVDNDGDLDLLLVSKQPSEAFLYFNDGDGTFTFSTQSWSNVLGYMGGFADIDNDMDLDLVFAGYPRSLMNDGNGQFEQGSVIPYAVPVGSPRSLAFADIEDDGDPDFVITDLVSTARLIRNDFNNANHYLKVKIVTPKGQAGGFGAKVYLYPANQAGGQLLGFREIRSNNGFCGQDDPVVHFGLGMYTAADVVVIFQDGTEMIQTFSQVDRIVGMDGRQAGRWVRR
jgi:hypothetical protein